MVHSAKVMFDRILDNPGPIFLSHLIEPLGEPFGKVFHSAVRNCMAQVEDRGRYYIGVTSDPFWRFHGPGSWKHHHSWELMSVLAVSTSTGIKRLERMVLADARVGRTRYNCTNIGEGGEAVRTDGNVTIPYFLYVVYGAW